MEDANARNRHFRPQPGADPVEYFRRRRRGYFKWNYASVNGRWNVNIDKVKATLEPHLPDLGMHPQELVIDNFYSGPTTAYGGDAARYYTVRSGSDRGKEYLLKINLPIFPWYLTESEVATMKYVRLQTSIPVAKVYAYDASGDNAMGHEWILMDKLGEWSSTFYALNNALDFDLKYNIVLVLAEWTNQLSLLRFNEIGSLYHRKKSPSEGSVSSQRRIPSSTWQNNSTGYNDATWQNDDLLGDLYMGGTDLLRKILPRDEIQMPPQTGNAQNSVRELRFRQLPDPEMIDELFELGPAVQLCYMWDWRLEYGVFHGPFSTTEHFLRSFVELSLHEIMDQKQRKRSELAMLQRKYDRKEMDTLPSYDGEGESRLEGDLDPVWSELASLRAKIESLGPIDEDDTIDWQSQRYLLDEYNQENEEEDTAEETNENDFSEDAFASGMQNCLELLYLLPKVCPPLGEKAAHLYHPNMTEENLLLDGEGIPIGLLDWSQVIAVPTSLMEPFPSIICSWTRVSEDVDNASERFDAILRSCFKGKLERLSSPAFDACKDQAGDYVPRSLDDPERIKHIDERDLRNIWRLAKEGGQGGRDEVHEIFKRVKRRSEWGF
ncbi:uncharacterized protein K452DRAFT_299483 [Aplosporella prunicola CBS 121167]|uniref:Altered inheritance of mitochondria protein 9, mitochondrial n=1 Tax=Aplosporella prunicola CBS 121167 TaxID=1176127 RepID=A0A6A6B991_9PEZI|nr:uncharacterized protein K452DRAFT_299483 [Aplosporella prunicola CBS 121167]KAF2140779.1 hypothetical protein K452DRAFT_299483 [Aplosporella prunicola CBS 121167]